MRQQFIQDSIIKIQKNPRLIRNNLKRLVNYERKTRTRNLWLFLSNANHSRPFHVLHNRKLLHFLDLNLDGSWRNFFDVVGRDEAFLPRHLPNIPPIIVGLVQKKHFLQRKTPFKQLVHLCFKSADKHSDYTTKSLFTVQNFLNLN